LAAVTAASVCDHRAFQPWVTRWPPVKSKPRLQPLSGAWLFVIVTDAWKPVSHWLVTA
jgi:hypothetical protein